MLPGRGAARLRSGLSAALAFVCWLGLAPTRADEASPFLQVDAASCAELEDKNLHVGPPDEDMVAACAALARRSALGQRVPTAPASLALLVVGAALVYAVLGAPIRAVAGLIGVKTERPKSVLAIGAPLAIVLRGLACAAILAVLSLPYALAAASIVTLVGLVLSLRDAPAGPADNAAAPASRIGLVLADAINDIYASAAGLLALAVIAERDLRWLAAGVALALAASLPSVIAARRRLRRNPSFRLAATALLAALIGWKAFSDPDLSAAFPGAEGAALSAAAFAIVVLAAGWRRVAALLRSPAPTG
ncbi:MAG TPA: hypothetical protein VEH77_03450 [Roseiarcus sp.]|nr:hypothetical protein [Roseiarcus sp.]